MIKCLKRKQTLESYRSRSCAEISHPNFTLFLYGTLSSQFHSPFLSLSSMEFHAQTEARLRLKIEEDRLRSKIEQLEKMNEGLEKELRNLQKESFQRLERLRSELLSKEDEIERLGRRRETLVEENEGWKRRFRSLEAENTQLEARSQAELRKKSQEAWMAVTAMARRTAARLCKKGRGGGDEDEEEESEPHVDNDAMKQMMQPFAEALESIEKAFDEKEEEMEVLRRGLEKALSGKEEEEEEEEEEEMDFVDVGAFLRADGVLSLD